MKCLRLFLLGVAPGVVLAACGGSVPSTTAQSSTSAESVSLQQVGLPARRACPEARPNEAQCDVLIIKTGVQPDLAGWAPSDLQAAYEVPSSSKGSGQIVAIVDAYDNPNVASDLAAYRSHFGLPAANFTKYNQNGQTSNYPNSCTGQDSWCIEIDLDVEMVSAICPNCTIHLIESNTNSLRDLDMAEKEAVKLGTHIVSNSWGCYSPGCRWRTHAFESPGVVYLAAAGDIHYGSYEPARLANVVSVGGTVLEKLDRNTKKTCGLGPAAAVRRESQSPRGSTILVAKTGPPTTLPPSLGTWRNTTPTMQSAAGSRLAARALPRQYSPASTRSPATPAHKRMPPRRFGR